MAEQLTAPGYNEARRRFLRTALLSPVAIAASTSYLAGCASQPRQETTETEITRYYFLDEDSAAMWRAMIPVIIAAQGQAPSAESVERDIRRIDDGLRRFSAANREKMADLFTLLSFTLTRGMTTGVWGSWENAAHDDLNAFLDSWRDSSLATLNQGYTAIVQVAAMTYYGAEENREASGYPGPPQAIKDALPQFSQERAS